jgi:hypothetical protein
MRRRNTNSPSIKTTPGQVAPGSSYLLVDLRLIRQPGVLSLVTWHAEALPDAGYTSYSPTTA